MSRLRLAVLISGRGSNMEAILDAAERLDYPAKPVLILTNRPESEGLKTAKSRGIATSVIDHKAFGTDREAFEREMQQTLTAHQVEMIALAGFMRILTPWFVKNWAGRMINIHPSLLPKYPGLQTHQRALDAGDAEAGCSVHWVTEGVDEGDVIAQARVPIEPGETSDSLAEKVLMEEHRLYPKALEKACAEIGALAEPSKR